MKASALTIEARIIGIRADGSDAIVKVELGEVAIRAPYIDGGYCDEHGIVRPMFGVRTYVWDETEVDSAGRPVFR